MRSRARGPRAAARAAVTARRPGWMPRPAALLLALALCGAPAGCVKHAPQDEAQARQARSQALIEAGNTAYRAQDYQLAAKRYAAAVVVKKDDPAAYFGLGMALKKLGRDEEARAAYARARELAQEARQAAGPDAPEEGR